jgi:hypothetical protein
VAAGLGDKLTKAKYAGIDGKFDELLAQVVHSKTLKIDC